MIRLEHVSKSYSAGIPALNDINLNIEEGEFVFVVGESGSGKSTLIKLLLKELEPTEGTIRSTAETYIKYEENRFRATAETSAWSFRISVCSRIGMFMRMLRLRSA